MTATPAESPVTYLRDGSRIEAQPGENDPQGLAENHQKLLDDSAIDPHVAQERGYRTVTQRGTLERFGFGKAQCRLVPGLLIPIFGVDGQPAGYQLRPDAPRVLSGKLVKYEARARSKNVLDVHPRVRPHLTDPKRLLLFTEGIRKSDSAVSRGLDCIGLNGVFGWRGTGKEGGKTLLPDFEFIALNGREVRIAFDSDVMTKDNVRQSLRLFKAVLERKGAKVRVIYLPPGPGGAKVGVDDFLATPGNGMAELLALAEDKVRGASLGADGEVSEGGYFVKDGCIYMQSKHEDAPPIKLTNFVAKITNEVVTDDGVEQRRTFELFGSVGNGQETCTFRVPSAEFEKMAWPTSNMGARAATSPGLREEARHAIQMMSRPGRRLVYASTGWRCAADGQWIYVHAAGAIGAAGALSDIEADLPPSLTPARIPHPPTGEALIRAIKAALRFFDVAPARLAFPPFAASFRAPVPKPTISVYLHGPSGTLKTSLAAVCQGFFGRGFSAKTLPLSFDATSNAREEVLFVGQDMLIVVDDLAPASGADMDKATAAVDRVLRATANGSARQRCRTDGSLRPAHPPRALVLATGEMVLGQESAQARAFLVEVKPGDIDLAVLTECQQHAASGLYVQVMAAFLAYLAPRYGNLIESVPERMAKIRAEMSVEGQHRRTPELVAELAIGLQEFLRFAHKAGAITVDEGRALWERGLAAIAGGAKDQGGKTEALAHRYVSLLRAAIVSGRAHLVDEHGGRPDGAHRWGWRAIPIADRHELRPSGDRIGWLSDGEVFLDDESAFVAVQRMANDSGRRLAVTLDTMTRRLEPLLASTDTSVPGRKWLRVRKVLEGVRRRVLHVKADVVLGDEEGAEDGGREGRAGAHGARNGATNGALGADGASLEPRKDPTFPEEFSANGSNGSTIPTEQRLLYARTRAPAHDAHAHAQARAHTYLSSSEPLEPLEPFSENGLDSHAETVAPLETGSKQGGANGAAAGLAGWLDQQPATVQEQWNAEVSRLTDTGLDRDTAQVQALEHVASVHGGGGGR